jgi:glycosyltransferase involved in cell wall biosynthesis
VKGLGAGGAERLLVSMARVADHDRFEYVVAYVLPHKTAFRPSLEAAGVRVFCLQEPGDGRLGWLHRLHEVLRREHFDVVHTHSPVVAGVARAVARLLGHRRPALISTEHNSWASYLWPTRLLNAALHPLDDRRFAVSSQARDSIWRPLRRGVEVLVHGVLPEDYEDVRSRRDTERRRLDIPADAIVVSTVANLRREKGYPELLTAAAEVLSEEPGTVFLAAGQGALESQLHLAHRQLRLGNGFRFLGQVDDVPELLAASDLFVLPSRFEGTPIAIMEALCVGLPVVGTTVGGIPEQVTDGVEGLLVPPRDPSALTRALLTLVRDSDLRARMSVAAKHRGVDFDIRRAAAQIETAYLSVVGDSVGTEKPGLSGS